MELLTWIAVGALAGGVASLTLPTAGRVGKLGRIAAGVAAAVVAGLVVNAVFGDIAHIRVLVITRNTYGTFSFGLAPLVGASVAALMVLVSLQRTVYAAGPRI